MLRSVIVMTGLFVLLTAGCADNQQSAAAGDVAARVNGVAIRVSDIDRIIEQQLRDRAAKEELKPTLAELAMIRLQVLDRLVTQEALYQWAMRQKIVVTADEVTQRIGEIKRDRGLSEEDFQRMLRDLGQQESEFRGELKRQVAIRKLYDREVTPRITATNREVQEFYQAHRAQFVERRGFLLSQIMVSSQVNNVPQDAVGADEAERKIREIYDQLRVGGDFATVARSRSEDPITGARGGGPTFVPENSPDLPPAFIRRLTSMRQGDVTEPIRAGDRWYIFKLDSRVTRDRELTLEEVRAQIVTEIRKQREEVLQAVVTQIALNEARVENFMALRMLENPTNFGNLRPISLPADSQDESGGSQ